MSQMAIRLAETENEQEDKKPKVARFRVTGAVFYGMPRTSCDHVRD